MLGGWVRSFIAALHYLEGLNHGMPVVGGFVVGQEL